MTLSPEFILEKFSHVFNNEFNTRKILHSVVDENWGKHVEYVYVTNHSYYNNIRAVQLRALTRTLVLVEDKNGEVELIAFWQDFGRDRYCYSVIHKQSLYVPYLSVKYRT